jgi:hypothetical protein
MEYSGIANVARRSDEEAGKSAFAAAIENGTTADCARSRHLKPHREILDFGGHELCPAIDLDVVLLEHS